MNWAAIGWICLLVVFLLAEAVTVTVVSLWFAAGALVAMIVAFFGGQLWLQAVVFTVVSIALLLALRPITRKYITPRISPTNVDAIIGTRGVVTEEINNLSAAGRVKLGAMEWSARSSSGQVIAAGTQVVADKIEGVKVFVTPVNEHVSI